MNTAKSGDFKYFIDCALDGKISWETLSFFLNDLTPTFPKAKELNKILLQEFQSLHNDLMKLIAENKDAQSKYEFQGDQESKIDESVNELEIKDDQNEHFEPDFDNFENEPQSDCVDLDKNNDEFQMESNHEDPTVSGFDMEENTQVQIRDNQESEKFKCQSCGKIFKHKKTLIKHCKKLHPENDQLKKYEEGLFAEKSFKCQNCDRKFKFKKTLHRHYKKIHIGSKLACDLCGKTFYDLKRHMELHTSPHCCSTCSKTFRTLDQLNLHEKRHKKQKLKCDSCDIVCKYPSDLKIHERTHTGENPYQCHICDKWFRFHSSWRKHQLSHVENSFNCKICGKTFKSKDGKSIHERNHKDKSNVKEKIFQCTNCGKRYDTKYKLINHEIIHSGEKNFICELCDKSFFLPIHLKNHIQRTHGTEKTFQCKSCGKKFKTLEYCEKHERNHKQT